MCTLAGTTVLTVSYASHLDGTSTSFTKVFKNYKDTRVCHITSFKGGDVSQY